MRKAAVILTAMMILVAGCGGGGGTATPTETPEPDDEGTMTPDGDTPMDGDTDSQPNVSTALSNLSSSGSGSGTFGNAAEVDATLYNGSEQINLLIQNDTAANRTLIRLGSPSGGTNTLYSTSEFTALQNTTSGQVQYGEPNGNLGFGVAFAAVFIFAGSVAYAGIVEWEPAGTTSDGSYVYEADSLNETALNQNDDQSQSLTPGFDQSSVQSVDGRLVISSDGQLQSINVEIATADGTFGTDLTVSYDPVSVSQPGWVDESQAP